MKKRIAAVLCAAMLMLAMPTMAFAAGSSQDTAVNKTSGSVTATIWANGTSVTAEPTTDKASNVPAGANVLGSFEVKADDPTKPVTFSFYVGTQYAGYNVTCYADHGDSVDAKTAVVDANGNVSFTFDKNSIFSVVLGDKAASSANTGATSPVTGIDVAGVAGVTVVAAIAACGAVVALRKKTNE